MDTSDENLDIPYAAAASVSEVEYLLSQFWAFRRIFGQARQQQLAFHVEDKLLTACVLEALQRDIIMGLCRLEDKNSKEGLRGCKDAVRKAHGQTRTNDFMKSISRLKDELKALDLKQSHRNRYISHLNLPFDEQPKSGSLEIEIESLINLVIEILESVGCTPNSSYQCEGVTIEMGVTANALIPTKPKL